MNMKIFLLIVLVVFVYDRSYAQSQKLKVEVYIDSLSFSDIRTGREKTTEGVFKFYHHAVADSNIIFSPCHLVVSSEINKKVQASEDTNMNAWGRQKLFYIQPEKDSFQIFMETYEDDKGDVCIADKGDDHHSITPFTIRIANIAAGIFSKQMIIASADNKFAAAIKIRYELPLPDIIQQANGAMILDVQRPLALDTYLHLPNKKGLSYFWEYKIENTDTWKFLAFTNFASLEFIAAKKVFSKPLTTNTNLLVRVKVRSEELDSKYTEPSLLEFTPASPKVIWKEAIIKNACANNNNGSFGLPEINSHVDSIAYYIIPGRILVYANYPDDCKGASKLRQGIIASNSKLMIDQLAPGDYCLVVYNAGLKVEDNFFFHYFTIGKYDKLTIKSHSIKDAGCKASADGKISITANGGFVESFKASINPSAGTLSQNGNNIVFTNLPPNTYTISIKDNCGQEAIKAGLEISEKAPALKGVISEIIECTDNNKNAVVVFKMADETRKYNYTLTKDAEVFNGNNVKYMWSVSSLSKGTYSLHVTDAEFPDCSFWDTSIVIEGINLFSTIANDESENSLINRKQLNKNQYHTIPNREAIRCVNYHPITPSKKSYYIVIKKKNYQLLVYDSVHQLIVAYPAVFGNDDLSDKLMMGDKKTPEGEFAIKSKAEHAKWDKFLLLTFPNAETITKFNERKRKGEISGDAKMGGDVGIHGTWPNDDGVVDLFQNWTDGCIALKNEHVREIYQFIATGSKVIIRK